MKQVTLPEIFILWICRIVAAVILVQSLFFKFSASPESVYIFDKVGLGAPGRIGSGIAELIAAILLLMPSTSWMGALLALGVMGGAIMSHLTILGIVVMGDNGLLFALALIVAFCSATILFISRQFLPIIGTYFSR